MSPFWLEQIGSFVRSLVIFVAGRFGATLTPEQQAVYVTDLIALAMWAWSAWQKYQSRRKLMVALAAPMQLSEKAAERMVAQGDAPSVMTDKKDVPL